jgi:hypothetical protein
MSSQPVTETSGTESTATSELDPAVTARSETLVDGLEELSETAGPPPPPPSKAGRRFVLIVTGTVPGEDLTAERDLVLKTMERAMLGLDATHGVKLNAAAYRSDPTEETSKEQPEATDTAQDAADTSSPDAAGGESSHEESSAGSSDGSDSSSEESTSPSDATSS